MAQKQLMKPTRKGTNLMPTSGMVNSREEVVAPSPQLHPSGGHERTARASAVMSSVSSSSTQILRNRLESEKKISDMELEMAAKKAELKQAEADLKTVQRRLEMKEKLKQSAHRDEAIEAYQEEIININSTIESLQIKLELLELSFVRRKSIIEKEEQLRNEELREDDAVDDPTHLPDEVAQARRTQEWVGASHQESTQREIDVENDFTPHKWMDAQQNVPVSVPDLVSALQRAFPTQSSEGLRDHLVKKHLPYFSGRPEDWLIFINEFRRTRSKDNAINLGRLRSHLKGNASEAVHHLTANPANVPKILDILEKRFGNPKHIISTLIEKAKNVKSPDMSKPESIITFGAAIDALVTNIISYSMTDYINNVQLLNELVDKLPATLRREWFNFVDQPGVIENLESLQRWMEIEVNTAYRSVKPRAVFEEDRGQDKKKRFQGVHAAKEGEPESCENCGYKNHTIYKCIKFSKLGVEEKLKTVREKGLCYKCLRKGHQSSQCEETGSCGLNGCTGRHHRLIHRLVPSKGKQHDKREPQQPRSVSTAKNAETSLTEVSDSDVNSIAAAGCGLCVIPVSITGPNGTETVIALLDSGASFSMIEDGVAEKIGLEGHKKPLSFNVFGKQTRTETESRAVGLMVKGTHRNSVSYSMTGVRTVTSIGIPACPLNLTKLKDEHPYLECVRAKNIPSEKPRMLIGYDFFRLFYPLSTVEGPEESGPAGHWSRLGWYISGLDGERGCFAAFGCFENDTDDQLHSMMKDFFSIEDKGIKPNVTPSRSKEDKRALEILEQNTVKVGKNWETCLLWKDDNPILPPSQNMAFHRLRLMEKKMDRNAEFSRLCCEKFDDYIAKGYLVPVSSVREKIHAGTRKWYLPWFFSYHATKKPRLVFDDAAKAGGKSLNDFLLKGPDMLNSLPDVLMRFRTYPVALTADIKEMFHQVKLNPMDWPSQTILYRGMNRDEPPQEYYMTVLFFGSASSPCSAIFAKNKNALQYIRKYPEAVDAILNNFYMDDYLGGAKTLKEAIQIQKQITWIHAEGGFEICKWNTNSEDVLRSIPENIRAERKQSIMQKGDMTLKKTLGMWWCPESDQFQFKLNLRKIPEEVLNEQRRPTKREVTSFVMALFDPLGFLSPLKIRALIIIQNIWRSGIAWDTEISSTVHDQWKQWLIELEEIRDITIPRKFTTFANVQAADLHVFVDASEEAYSCAAFLVHESEDQKEVSFVAGKARVAPLKGLTIPRMELQAALIGSRLARTISECLSNVMKFKLVTFWSDSKTVLCWLRSETGRFKIFVQTRIGEIQELCDSSQWKWVPTKMNVADDATRFKSDVSFNSSCRWLQGVPFLLGDASDWPAETTNVKDDVIKNDLEIRSAVFAVSHSNQEDVPLLEISRFSSWMKLIRSTAAVVLAIRRFRMTRKKRELEPSYISTTDMKKAENLWILRSQRDSFTDEITQLELHKPLPKQSRLAFLSPILNENGLVVLGGRIDAAVWIPERVRRPPILDPAHPYTKLQIDWIHVIGGHHGQERVISELRKKAWIIDCRKAVRSCWANCQTCKLRKLQPTTPEMGPLPSCRLGESQVPFANTGVDYFGPLQVKVNRSIVKRWGVLFACMTTRAVHLDLADGLDTGEFLNVLSRFICVRGSPQSIWCDNGKNFVGANTELKAATAAWNEDEILRAASVKGIQIHFQPPASPHMVGSQERLIGIAKRILTSMLKAQAPRESILRTLLFEAMDIMNSRPLSYASTDPDDAECLTPNHLLRMSCLDGPSLPGIYEEGDRYRAAWKYCKHLSNEFWRRWTDDVLPILAKRKMWTEKSNPIQVGDVVIVKDNQFPRSSWKKGIVTRTFPGKDGQVRVVDVRVAISKPGDKSPPRIKTYRRPVVKVIPVGERIVLEQHWEGEYVPAQKNSV